MHLFLNQEQAKGLSDFFFDIAKGLVLGGIGIGVVGPSEIKLIVIIPTLFIAMWSIKLALSLLD